MEYVETMLCENQKIDLLDFHLDRLKWGLYQNGFHLTSETLQNVRSTILNHIPFNNAAFKIRYVLNIVDDKLKDKVEVYPLGRTISEKIDLGIFPFRFKSLSSPWNAKTTERSLYDEAVRWAKDNQCDDAIILNERGYVIETTIYSIFLLKDEKLLTPPLSDMPVKGVMRSWMMSNCVFPIIEKSLTINDVQNADQILLTNAVRGIQFGHFSK